jgi:hypothetical protein
VKPVFCHHCGNQIVFNVTYPNKRNSHWAHAILVFNGKAHTLGNALMEQRCSNRVTWATPKKGAKSCTPQSESRPRLTSL